MTQCLFYNLGGKKPVRSVGVIHVRKFEGMRESETLLWQRILGRENTGQMLGKERGRNRAVNEDKP